MKKIISLLLIAVMCLSLSACKSEEVKAVEEAISAIGVVSLDSEKAIIDAEKAFAALSEDDKNKVSNYNSLLEARSKYDDIPKEITLTTSNIKNYINFDVSYGKHNVSKVLGLNLVDVDVYLNTYLTKPGKLSNVKVTVEIICPTDWIVTSSDSAYDESNDRKMVIDINMPTDGGFTDVHNIGRAMYANAPQSDCTLVIKSVSGKFIEEK